MLYSTDGGAEVACVVWTPEETALEASPPRCLGHAVKADLRRDETNQEHHRRTHEVAIERIIAHGLSVKAMATDYINSSKEYGKLTVIYFTIPGRMDFRALIGNLVRAVRVRVDPRQMSSRGTARLAGGAGMCDWKLYYVLSFDEVESVSMRLARSQNLAADPLQIRGICGELLCCLVFEHPLYVDFLKQAPQIRERVTTLDDPGRVVGHMVLTGEVVVRTANGVRRRPLMKICTKKNQAMHRITPDGGS